MSRSYLLAPVLLILVGVAALVASLTVLEGAGTLTDTPTQLAAPGSLPTRISYLHIEGATLTDHPFVVVRVMHSRRSGALELDHEYYRSWWTLDGDQPPFVVHSNEPPRGDMQLLGVYHPSERTLVGGFSGAEVARFVHELWLWAALVLLFGVVGLVVGLRSERASDRITRVSGPAPAGFRTSARAEDLRVLERGASTQSLVLLLSAAGASFCVSLYFAYAQLTLDPEVDASQLFQITPLFVLPVLLYVALHERVTITITRGQITRRNAFGWTTRLALEPGQECVIRLLVTLRRTDVTARMPFSVEIHHEGGRFRIARVVGESLARELASKVNRLVSEVSR
ncbi:MAG: hypothetical protein J0L92_21345 [Deltaproteobacteria bacterium]|nr:hypothetical protein [Deltaproteobacteria bacterium]